MFNWMEERNKTGSKLRIGVVIHRFSVDDKVKTIVGKQGKLYHQKRKGSHAIVLKTGISLSKPCYWVKFNDNHEEWYDEDELNGVGTVPLNGLIIVHERIAKVVKKWNNECWRLKFIDNNEIVNVFYPLSEDWHCA